MLRGLELSFQKELLYDLGLITNYTLEMVLAMPVA
jgi:hypothetical protein